MKTASTESAIKLIEIDGRQYRCFSTPPELRQLPYTLKILRENLVRHGGDDSGFARWLQSKGQSEEEITFQPARVLVHDMNCIPFIADLASMREAAIKFGLDPEQINPQIPVDIVVDHSTIVDNAGTPEAFQLNLNKEFLRNKERFELIRWAQKSFKRLRVVPPGTGILHQINLEHLSPVVRVEQDDSGNAWIFPDTLVGTDSHTPMVNGIGVVGWGVGGIEAQSASLGDALTIRIPEVVGVRLIGELGTGVTATDLALTLTQQLRKLGVVEKVIEFFGPGVTNLKAADRATVSNMAPEYGAFLSVFPFDEITGEYMRLVGHSNDHIDLAREYAQAAGLWGAQDNVRYTQQIEFDLSSVEMCLAGPRKPQDRVALSNVPTSFHTELPELSGNVTTIPRCLDRGLGDGAVLIAAITSCTNTSNPDLMLAAGIVARKARAMGLKPAWFTKTSLSPGSLAVSDYLNASGLQKDLDALGFHVTGYGCMTCCGNSGGIGAELQGLTTDQKMVGAAVLSGNRNFENRIHPAIRAAYLASPPLVVIYALAGSVLRDLSCEPVAHTPEGTAVYIKDLWPTDAEIRDMHRYVTHDRFSARFGKVFDGTPEWQALEVAASQLWKWDADSTYIAPPPYFDGMKPEVPQFRDIIGARPLVLLGDNVTTDHISPVSNIDEHSEAGRYLLERGVAKQDFNQFGTRRGNHEVMMRGVYSNPRLQNELVAGQGIRGGYTLYDEEVVTIFEAARRYREAGTPLIVIAGKAYGTGSSRDWAAKGPSLLGVQAVVAESFERIHRVNLIGTGVLPLQFVEPYTRADLNLDGSETLEVHGMAQAAPRATLMLVVRRSNGHTFRVPVMLRADTNVEIGHLQHGGLLRHVLRDMMERPQHATTSALQ